MEILLKNHKISCEIIKRKRKTLEIQVQPDGSLRVLSPKGLKKEHIHRSLLEKEDWIIKKIQEIKKREIPKELTFQEGEIHHGFGKAKVLFFSIIPEGKHIKVRLTGQGFMLLGQDFSKERVKKALETWYRLQTEKRVAYFVKKYRNTLPRPTEVQVKTQKKRWGSCNHKGKVMFNWKLSMAPAWVVEYLVVHELSHMEEFNHSKSFWALVKETYPPWEEARRWLRENQWKLQRFE